MDDHACTDCGITVAGQVGAVRLIGRDGPGATLRQGAIVKLCSRCFLKRGEEARPLVLEQPVAAPTPARLR